MHVKKSIEMKNVLNNILLVLHIMKQKKQNYVFQKNLIVSVNHLANMHNQIIHHYVKIHAKKENIITTYIVIIIVLLSVIIININMMKI